MTGSARWLQRPLRVLDYVYNQRLADLPMAEVVDMCRRMHANVIHFHCQYNMHGGFDEYGMFFRSRLARQQNRDVLGEFLPLARRAGIRTVVYLNLHWYTQAFAAAHPDWRVRLCDGSYLEKLYGDDDTSCCINTPWRDWSFQLIEDLCAYPIDGVFYDGPITFLRRQGCYCDHCQALFHDRYGTAMPPPDPAQRQDYALLRQFATASMQRYYRDATATVRRTRPRAVAYGNCANAAEPDWAAGRVNSELIQETDALLAEGGFMYGRPAHNVFKTGASSRLYSTQAADKPAINAVSMAFSPWRWTSLSAAETRVLLSAAAIGVNPYYAVFAQGEAAAGVQAGAEVFAFLERHTDILARTESAATVALLQSGQTLNCYSGVDIPWADIGYQRATQAEAPGNYSRAFYGFYEMLVRSRVPFDIIDEPRLTAAALARYQALILPNAACLSDAQCAALTEFVQAGGHLIADFESSHYDPVGARRRELGLATAFGVGSHNRVSPRRRWDYAFRVDPSPPHLAWMETDFLPAPHHNLRVEPAAGTVQAVFSEPLTSNIVAQARPGTEAFLVENRLGRGVCHYFPGTFGEYFAAARPQAYPHLLAELLGAAKPLQLTGAPNLLEVHLRRQRRARRLLVHLVNLELGPIDAVVPAHGLRLQMPVPWPVQRAVALRADRPLRCRPTRGGVTVALPPVAEYEVVVLEG